MFDKLAVKGICPLRPDRNIYYFWNGYDRIRCAPGTHYVQENCTCMHGGKCKNTLIHIIAW